MLVDYHLHTEHSFDGVQTVDELCQAAIDRGVEEIAITEHMDLYRGKPYDYILNPEKTFDAISAARDRYQDKLVIRSGIELGQPMRNPAEAERFLNEWKLDFVIGSIHNMENDIDVGEYDYTTVKWDPFFLHYLDMLKDFAENYDYDVLGHVTYPMRYLFLKTQKCPSSMCWKDQYSEIFDIVIGRGKGIELNTSSIARKKGPLMPDKELLKLYHDLGGKIITLGSDAHVKEQTGLTAKIGQDILREIGFKEFSTYKNRKVIMHSL